MEIKLVDYTLDYLELSWKWLNDPEIKVLTNTPDFSLDQQLKWFNSLALKQTSGNNFTKRKLTGNAAANAFFKFTQAIVRYRVFR